MSENDKTTIVLKSVGDGPVLKKTQFQVSRSKTIKWVNEWLHKKVCSDDERIFIYIHQSFAPTPDTTIGLLFDNYASNGKLFLHFSRNPAWG